MAGDGDVPGGHDGGGRAPVRLEAQGAATPPACGLRQGSARAAHVGALGRRIPPPPGRPLRGTGTSYRSQLFHDDGGSRCLLVCTSVYCVQVYITSFRGPTYVFLATLKSADATSKWVLTGTAVLMQTDD